MIVDKIDSRPCWDKGAEIILHTSDIGAAKSLMEKYTEGKTYIAEIKEKRAKRSLDANAYCWVLCRKISEVLGAYSDEDVYKECIRKYGVSDIRPVREDIADDLCRMWDAQGIGNAHVILGDSKIEGYRNIKFYWGSSNYNTKDMARLIDGIVEDCKELDIETFPPDEIEQLKQVWGGD